MFRNLIKAWKRRQLRLAREKYAYWKARREALEEGRSVIIYQEQFVKTTDQIAEAAGKEALYMERAEILIQETR